MPRKLPLHVRRERDRHGKVRLYFRIGHGPRTLLPGLPGSQEFEAAYADALAGNVRRKSDIPGRERGTIAWGVASYLRSAEFQDLRPTTKTGYISRLDKIRVPHGHRSIKGMTRAGIERAILAPYLDRPGQRLAILKMLRVLIRHWIAIGELKADPSLGIRRPRGNEIRAWTETEIETFERRWPIGSKERLAFALMLHTGQRRSDVHRMTWADLRDGAIRVTQQKTTTRLLIPVHADLAAVLDAAPREHVTILNTAHGKPFTVSGFGNFMRDAIAGAGLPLECQPHGLRKAAGRRLAEAGCSANEIMAILGHKSLAEAERYTREADQGRMARAAMVRLSDRKANTHSRTTPNGFGKNGEK